MKICFGASAPLVSSRIRVAPLSFTVEETHHTAGRCPSISESNHDGVLARSAPLANAGRRRANPPNHECRLAICSLTIRQSVYGEPPAGDRRLAPMAELGLDCRAMAEMIRRAPPSLEEHRVAAVEARR